MEPSLQHRGTVRGTVCGTVGLARHQGRAWIEALIDVDIEPRSRVPAVDQIEQAPLAVAHPLKTSSW